MQPASVAETEETEVEMSDVESCADNMLSSDGTFMDSWIFLLLFKCECCLPLKCNSSKVVDSNGGRRKHEDSW